MQRWFRGTHLVLFFKSSLPESHWQILIVSNIEMNKRIRTAATIQKTIYRNTLPPLMMRCQVLQSLCLPVFERLLLIAKEQCSVHASILKEFVCLVFTKRVLLPSATIMEPWSLRHSFTGFTHHDMSVRWWSQFMYYAYQSTMPIIIVQQFHTLTINPIRGPKL